MSFIHYLILGHFERGGPLIRFVRNPSDGVYQPVVRHAIDEKEVMALLHEMTGAQSNELAFPQNWTMWLDAGYLVCDMYTRNPEAIKFFTRLVEMTQCEIYDVSCHCEISLRDWLAVTESPARA